MRSHLFFPLFLVCPSVLWAAASAVAPAGPGLSLAQVLESVRARNPDYAAARADLGRARAEAGESWALPDPEVGVEYWNVPRPGLDLGQAQQTWIDFSQDFPSPAKLLAAARVYARARDTAGAQADAVLAEKLEAAADAYWDLYQAAASLTALARIRATLDQLLEAARHRIRYGPSDRMGQFMVPMLRMQLAETDNQALSLTQDRTAAEAKLESLTGWPVGAALPRPLGAAPDPPPGDEAGFLEAVASRDPAVAAARRGVLDAEARKSLQDAAWQPDLMLQYSTMNGPGMAPAGMAMAKVNVPFLYFWRRRGESAAAEKGVERARDLLAGARAEARRQGVAAWSAYRTALAQWRRGRDLIVPESREALGLALDGFAGGDLGASEALQAVTASWMAESGQIQLLARVGRERALLDRLAGVGLGVGKEARHGY